MTATDPADPIALFQEWFEAAKAAEPNDPEVMALASADASGLPNVRMVLLKEIDAAGLVFYTNSESDKGREMAANPKAAICFHWKSLRRQIRAQGAVKVVSAAEADAYFAARPHDAQIGAWASSQSRPLASRLELEKAVAGVAAKFAGGPVPRPPHWLGYRLAPDRIEFWESRPFRLHDRLLFERSGQGWETSRLFP
jgi:pyridoxamine 5'-phosphate oxidase